MDSSSSSNIKETFQSSSSNIKETFQSSSSNVKETFQCPTLCQQFKFEITHPSTVGFDVGHHHWKTIFSESYYPNIISPSFLFYIRCIYFLLFWGIWISEFIPRSSHDIPGVKWLYFVTNWNWLLNIIFVLCISSLSAFVYVKCSSSSVLHDDEQHDGDNAVLHCDSNCCIIPSRFYDRNTPVFGEDNSSCPSCCKCSKKTPLWVKFTWIVHEVTLSASIIIMLLFWFVLVPRGTSYNSYLQIFKHLINSFLLLIHSQLSRLPFLLWHIVYLYIFSIVYTFFTILLYVCQIPTGSGRIGYVYGVLNFAVHPMKSVLWVVLSLSVIVPLVYFIIWLLFYRRNAFVNTNLKICTEKEQTACDVVDDENKK